MWPPTSPPYSASGSSLLEDGTLGEGPGPNRPAEGIAAEIAGTAPRLDEGDGSALPDPDETLRRFVERSRPEVCAKATADDSATSAITSGARPVPSSRFL